MIIKSTRVQTKSGVYNLSNHLLNKRHENEEIRLLEGSEADFETFHKEAILDGSKYAFRHFSINPGCDWTYEQQLKAVDKIKQEYQAESHPHLLVRHSKKLCDGTKNEHLHLVLPERFNGRTLSSSWSYARNEKISRECEFEFGHEIVVGKHNKSSAYFVSNKNLKNILLENSIKQMPKASFSSIEHQKAKRQGLDLPKTKKLIKELHAQSDGFGAFHAALKEHGFVIGSGKKTAIVENLEGEFIGSLNRLVGMRKKDFLKYVKGVNNEKIISKSDGGKTKKENVRSVAAFGNQNKGKHGRNSRTSQSGRREQDRPSDRDIGPDSRQPEEPRRTLIEDSKFQAGLMSSSRAVKLDAILDCIKKLNDASQMEAGLSIPFSTRRPLVKEAGNACNFAPVVASGSSGDIGAPITSEDALRQIRAAPKPLQLR